jgi:S-adenosylmethionine decarboxylase
MVVSVQEVNEAEKAAPDGYTEYAPMFSYALDMQLADPSILVDEARLLEIMRSAAEHGQAVVLGACSHVFPNGAVTAVLLLSQSHLSVHTWPERGVANFDLLTCGPLCGDRMIAYLKRELAPIRTHETKDIREFNP